MRAISSKIKCARRALLLASVAVPVVALSHEVAAQQITTSVQGTVVNEAGDRVAGATVTIIDTRTGRTTVRTTNANGLFSATNLETGGPYNVIIEDSSYQNQRIEDVYLSVGASANLSITLASGADIEEIVVTGTTPQNLTQLAIGPGQVFGTQALEALPSIGRDFRDTLRLDPRVNINEESDNAVSCLGGNNRFNTFTIDGVNVTDAFGLNASGLPSRNTTPIPLDATREVAVEFAPFDVEYGQFTGCNVNLLTKSGENEFHGTAFFLYTNDNLTGSSIDGEPITTAPFDDYHWGATLGGPIIKDKLFFYVGYEETDESDIQDEGPAGQGFANPVSQTPEDIAEVQSILEGTYGQNTGGIIQNLPETTERYFGRLDWFVNDQHRVAATYTRLRERNVEADDFGFDGFTFASNFEEEGSQVDIFSVRVFSDWTEKLSTEVRFSYNDTDDVQGPLLGGERQSANPVPRIITNTPNGQITHGPGFFRAANELNTERYQFKAKADYRTGNHILTFGYELDKLEVFNLFVPNSTGTLEFDSIDDLREGIVGFGFVTDSFSGDINDAAADWGRSIHSVYAQDEWNISTGLTVTLGLRYDFYKSNDNPTANPLFEQRYGFSNTQAFDGLDILMPRAGFTYDAPFYFYGETTFRGGAALFAGGDPSVWFSNAFTNFGANNASAFTFNAGCTDEELDVVQGGSFTGVPNCLFQAAQQFAQANNGNTDAVDPDFKLPSVLRMNFGFTHIFDFDGAANGFFDNWQFDFDFIYTQRRNSPDFIDLTLSPVGVAPDGRPIFARIDPTNDGCNATFIGPRQGFGSAALDPACLDGSNGQDSLLLNTQDNRDGGSTSVSFRLAKDFDYTLFERPGSVNVNLGYAYTEAKDANPTTSSTAGSNIEEVALSIVNQAPLANSQFVNRHNITASAWINQDFFEDVTTSLGLFLRIEEGRPFSYTFGDDTTEDLFGDTDDEARQLLFVPTGPNDPRFDFSGVSAGDVDAFFAALDEFGISQFGGSILNRNTFRDPWSVDLDLRFQQEIPTPWLDDDRLVFFVDVDNFLNMLDSSWNRRRFFDRGDVGEAVPLIQADLSDDGTQYVVTELSTPDVDTSINRSLWQVQFGVRYSF